jgi:hypothetical protein
MRRNRFFKEYSMNAAKTRRCVYLREVLTHLPHTTNRQIPEVIPQALSNTSQPVQLVAS